MSFYGTVVGGQSHWDDRGYSGTLTEPLLLLGSVFVDSVGWRTTSSGTYVSRFPGQPTSSSQVREWPRTGATTVYGIEIDDATVPDAVVRAAYEAAWYEHENPGGLNQSLRSDQRVAKETFEGVSFSYYAAGRATIGVSPTTVIIPTVMNSLAQVLVDGGNPYGITGVVA